MLDENLEIELLNAVEEGFERQIKSEQYFHDPHKWCIDMLGYGLWSKQREIAEALKDNKNIAVKAGHGVGKSYLVALLACWWIDTRYPKVFVASTAPNARQIGAIVWRYIRQIKNDIDRRHRIYQERLRNGDNVEGLPDHTIPGYITSENIWKMDGGIQLGFGAKPPDNKENDMFQGLHDGYVLAIGDEAVGLSMEMIDALGNITSNSNSRRLLICNPTNPSAYIAKIFKEDFPNWKKFTISVFDSPNITGEREFLSEDALEGLADETFIDDKIAEYGLGSPRYISRILGEFAWDLGDSFIKPEMFSKGIDNEIIPNPKDKIIIGADVSRFGVDRSVAYLNQSGRVRLIGVLEGENPTTVTGAWLDKLAMDYNADEVRIDGVGVGGGVVDELVRLVSVKGRKFKVVGYNSSYRSPDKAQWHNRRSYDWDCVRKKLINGEIDLDGDDEQLQDEVCSIGYGFTAGASALLIESKDSIKKKLKKKSPDYADAFIIALADLDDALEESEEHVQKIYQDSGDVLTSKMSNFYSTLRRF